MAKRKKAPAKRSLSANLTREADKKGLSGEARTRYIVGGTINAEKRHQAKLAGKKAATAASRSSKTAKKSPYLADGRKRLVLVVRKNAAASASRDHDMYSIYEEHAKTPYNSAIYRKRSEATQYAKIEAEKHNHPKGIHGQSSFI